MFSTQLRKLYPSGSARHPDHGCLACPSELAHAPDSQLDHIQDESGRCFAEICSRCITQGRQKVVKELQKQAKSERKWASDLCKFGSEVDVIRESLDRVELREFLALYFKCEENWPWPGTKGKPEAFQPRRVESQFPLDEEPK